MLSATLQSAIILPLTYELPPVEDWDLLNRKMSKRARKRHKKDFNFLIIQIP